MIGVVALSIAVGATFAVTRQSVRARVLWQVGSGLLVLAVAFDRWITGAHYITDIVGGALYGALAATVAMLVAGVKVPIPHELVGEIVRSRAVAEQPPMAPLKRAAVIFNPAKVTDWITFRRHVEYELKSRGWERALWLETTSEDPGRAMTEQAVRENVDLVLGAGGDGTIRVICSGLANTGIPFGLIPAGTGNLLARNIGIPLDEVAALDVAFDGVDKAVDLVSLQVDDQPPDHFAVMAGIGIDAVIMEGADAKMKKAVGSAAYFVSAAQNANHPAMHAMIAVDDQPPIKRRASVIVVGNVGFLLANIQLIPGARADDGKLDVLVASPRTLRDWVRLTTRVLTRRRQPDNQLDRLTGRRVTITVEERDQVQLDGDTVGECNRLTAEVVPGALRLRVPRQLGELTTGNGQVSSATRSGRIHVPGAQAVSRAVLPFGLQRILGALDRRGQSGGVEPDHGFARLDGVAFFHHPFDLDPVRLGDRDLELFRPEGRQASRENDGRPEGPLRDLRVGHLGDRLAVAPGRENGQKDREGQDGDGGEDVGPPGAPDLSLQLSELGHLG